MPISSTEFSNVLVNGINELAELLERIDRRVSLVAGIDPLEPGSTPNLSQIRGYCEELRQYAAWMANEPARLAAAAEAKRAAEFADDLERHRNAATIDSARRAGVLRDGGNVRLR